MFQQIYLLLRKMVFSCWWRASEKEMRRIANYYGYQVKVRTFSVFERHPILRGIRLIGECRYREELLLVSSQETRVFWHELGHAASPLWCRYLFGKKIADWVISEISATVLGYYLNTKWWIKKKEGWL